MENHNNKTYQERMNKTASSKFGAIEKHLEKGVKLLDFGSGFSPEFIEQVQLHSQAIMPIISSLKPNRAIYYSKRELSSMG